MADWNFKFNLLEFSLIIINYLIGYNIPILVYDADITCRKEDIFSKA